MDTQIIKLVGQAAGIGGVAIGALLLIFRDVIRKEIFPGLTRAQAYQTIRLLIFLTFFIALAGIGAWLWVQTRAVGPAATSQGTKVDEGNFRRIYYQGFDFSESDAEAVSRAAEAGWLIGRRGDWEGHVTDGKYRLCNVSGNENASFTSRMSHYETAGKTTLLQDSEISVRVLVEPPNGSYSGAGILYRKSEERPDYLAYILQAGKTVSLLRRGESSLRVLTSKEFHSADAGSFHSLRLMGRGPRLDLYADGDHVYPSNKEQKIDLLDGEPGIFAYSTGCFVFDDFGIYARTQ